MGIRIAFNFHFTIFSRHNGTKAGWGATHIEASPRFGWNFFTNIRHWDREMKELLPPVFKWRIRTVEYYHEVEEKTWDFIEKKYNYWWKFSGESRSDNHDPAHLRMRQVVYRLPWLTVTNSYHTKLDEQRHEEFRKELEKEHETN